MENKNKIVYIELLRIISIFAVIVIHVSSVFLRNNEIGSYDWDITIIFNSLCRFCIPLFFMISGAVFLDIKNLISIKTMFAKYIRHIIFVLFFWGGIYYFFDLFIYNQQIEFKHFILFFFNLLSGNTGYHLWFLYELMCLYCMIPILQIIVKKLDRNHLEYLIFIFLLFESCIHLINIISTNIPLISSLFNFRFSIPLFTKYGMCLIMGYYLSHYTVSERTQKYCMCFSTFSLIIMPVCNILFSILLNKEFLFFSLDTGIFSISIAIVLFLYCKNKEEYLLESRYKDLILKIGGSVFGVYLIHVFFNSLLFHVIKINDIFRINIFISIFVYSIIIFLLSLFSTMLLCKNEKLSNLVR